MRELIFLMIVGTLFGNKYHDFLATYKMRDTFSVNSVFVLDLKIKERSGKNHILRIESYFPCGIELIEGSKIEIVNLSPNDSLVIPYYLKLKFNGYFHLYTKIISLSDSSKLDYYIYSQNDTFLFSSYDIFPENLLFLLLILSL